MSTHNSESRERGSKLHSLQQNRPSDEKTAQHSFSFVRRTTLSSERSLLPRFLAAFTAALLLAALPVLAKTKPKVISVESAIIENTGSTNTQGYAIKISTTGDILYHAGDDLLGQSFGKFTKPLPKLQTKKLFHDLDAAMPLTALPVRHGMRSASFGTQTYITYKGQRSPDLTFASDPRTVALKADIDQITKYYVGNAPRHPIVIHADR